MDHWAKTQATNKAYLDPTLFGDPPLLCYVHYNIMPCSTVEEYSYIEVFLTFNLAHTPLYNLYNKKVIGIINVLINMYLCNQPL